GRLVLDAQRQRRATAYRPQRLGLREPRDLRLRHGREAVRAELEHLREDVRAQAVAPAQRPVHVDLLAAGAVLLASAARDARRGPAALEERQDARHGPSAAV